ncbi:MAG: metallophosphoesterase [Bacilli bacterium]
MTREEKSDQLLKKMKKKTAKEKRKRHIKTFLKLFLVLSFIVVGIIFYAMFIATNGLVINENKISEEKLPSTFDSLKIIQFSDLHYNSSFSLENTKKMVKEINKRNPDIVVFTGDLIDKNFSINDDIIKKLSLELSKIVAPLGKYAVSGNQDYASNYFEDIMTRSNFKILNNQSELIYKDGYNPFLLVGLASSYLDNRNIQDGFSYLKENPNNELYTVLLLHEPDSIDTILTDYKVDLALAGHSHNGQIRLPLLGGILNKEGALKYKEPFYQIGQTKLYISGGLGTSNIPFRLFNHPSINFFRFKKEI